MTQNYQLTMNIASYILWKGLLREKIYDAKSTIRIIAAFVLKEWYLIQSKYYYTAI